MFGANSVFGGMTKYAAAAAMAAVVGAASGTARAQGDAGAGASVFKRCAACHVPASGTPAVGPGLAGVVGRKAGTAEGFDYSGAMKRSGVTWDDAALDKYLANPLRFMPGTRKTTFKLADDKERADVIAYLKTIK